MDPLLLAILIGCLVAFLTAWGVGAADLANIMSTTLSSKAVSVRVAICIAIVFEIAGAMFGGSEVSHTLQYDIIDTSQIFNAQIFIHGMLAVSMAGATWMLTASILGLPVSITNAIVGALVGLGWSVFGINAIHWSNVSHIAISWVTSPLIAGSLAYWMFINIQRQIFMRKHPDRYMDRYFPFYCLVVGIIFANMLLFKVLHHYNIHFGHNAGISLALLCGAMMAVFGVFLAKNLKAPPLEDRHAAFAYVEKKFGILMGFTACAMVFAHGSNDVPIAMGPLTNIVTTFNNANLKLLHFHYLQHSFLLFGSISVIIGLLMYGRKVIATVGSGITALTPSRAFAATLAAAVTVIVATSTGIPISATQTLVGGVLGVGLARGIGALNLTVVRNIFMSWCITIPAASLLAIGYFYLLDTFVTVF
jgi:PiT family inorganic phosphate transporter